MATVLRVHDGDVHPRVLIVPLFDRECRVAYRLCDAKFDVIVGAKLQPRRANTITVLGLLKPVSTVLPADLLKCSFLGDAISILVINAASLTRRLSRL